VDGLSSLLLPEELAQGLHAGQAETSLMLHMAPELVGPSRPVDGDHGPSSPLPPRTVGAWRGLLHVPG
jgi:creatinine amidohydrolase